MKPKRTIHKRKVNVVDAGIALRRESKRMQREGVVRHYRDAIAIKRKEYWGN